MRPIITLALAASLLVGCQTQTEKQSPNSVLLPSPTPVRAQQQQTAAPIGKGVSFDTDDCADRMHTLSGQLIFYYASYGRMPASLNDLRSVADPGEDTPTTCTVSKQPYVYNPAGLISGASPNRLVVYDATPAHAGTRWGVLFIPAVGRQQPRTDIIQIPEAAMASYRQAPELPPHGAQTQLQDATTQSAPQTIDQLSPELREKVLQQQRLLRQQLDLRRQQLQGDPNTGQQPAADPQQQIQQPIQQPRPQQQ